MKRFSEQPCKIEIIEINELHRTNINLYGSPFYFVLFSKVEENHKIQREKTSHTCFW